MILALALSGALSLAGCSSNEEREAEPKPQVVEESAAPKPEPSSQPAPAAPAWEDLVGTWCGGGVEGYPNDSCVTIVLNADGIPTNADHPESLFSFNEMNGECFSGHNGATDGPGAAADYCPAGIAMTSTGYVDKDPSQDRLWVGQGDRRLPYFRA